MAKFIKKILFFFLLIAIIDITSGFAFKYLKAHAKSGDTQKNYYISEKCCEDILILGSSRAANHYDPKVLSDSLGLSCYNCGEPGCGIITAYARYSLVKTRHKPKFVLYEVTPHFDYFKTDDYSKYLGRVKQYADKPTVRSLFLELGDELEGLRLVSNMYKNNGFIVHNIMDNISQKAYRKGFEPLHGRLSKEATGKPYSRKSKLLDEVKYSYIEDFIIELQKDTVTLCFMVSPKCMNSKVAALESWEYEPVKELCNSYNIPFIDHTYLKGVSTNRNYFQDFGHLNQDGAEEYSKIICKELKALLDAR